MGLIAGVESRSPSDDEGLLLTLAVRAHLVYRLTILGDPGDPSGGSEGDASGLDGTVVEATCLELRGKTSKCLGIAGEVLSGPGPLAAALDVQSPGKPTRGRNQRLGYLEEELAVLLVLQQLRQGDQLPYSSVGGE